MRRANLLANRGWRRSWSGSSPALKYTLRILEDDGSEGLVARRSAPTAKIKLTIDLNCKNSPQRPGLLQGCSGPGSVGLAVLYSNPGFDPNRFTAGMTGAEWQELGARKSLNRALSGITRRDSSSYCGCRTVERAIDPAARSRLPGKSGSLCGLGRLPQKRVHPELKSVDLYEAMKFSDNIFARRAGPGARSSQHGALWLWGRDLSCRWPFRLAREVKSEIAC